MRFLSLGFRRPAFARKHEQLPVPIHSWTESRSEIASMDDEDAALDALLRELGEDPFDVWSRLCVPDASSDRGSSAGRVRRVAKPRAGLRRRVGDRG